MAASKSPRARLLHIRDEIDGVSLIVRGVSFVQYLHPGCAATKLRRTAQLICPTGCFADRLSSPICKNISVLA